MKRFAQFFVAAASVLLLVPAVAAAAPRMYVGFHDDPSFRWDERRLEMLDQAKSANANIVRSLVTWANVAPTRPANAANPFDPAYQLNDLDELIRNAQARDMEVLLTIWGTPKWANGGKTPNYLPTRMSDMTNFARALSSRYSGRYPGYPFVRFYTVWNESNLNLFLAPQFDKKGRSVGPKLYAKLAAAAYTGIKRGNFRALVGLGETSSHGRDKVIKGQTDTHSPGRFAQLVAAANPRLKFDAWAQHPYPFPVSQKPTQKVRYPNVTLKSYPRFEKDLDKWFKRKNVQLWITEYGHEVKADGERNGVSRSQQAAYLNQAVTIAKKDPRVGMFIWFVFRDHATSEWQSGLITKTGVAKPALRRWTSVAKAVDIRNPIVTVKAGRIGPVLTVPLRQYAAGSQWGEPVGFNINVFENQRLVAEGQPSSPFGIDTTAKAELTRFRPVKGHTYTANVTANIFSGGGLQITRTFTILAR